MSAIARLVGFLCLGMSFSCSSKDVDTDEPAGPINVDHILEEVIAGGGRVELRDRSDSVCKYLDAVEAYYSVPLGKRLAARVESEDFRFLFLMGGYMPRIHGIDDHQERSCVVDKYGFEEVNAPTDAISCQGEMAVYGKIATYTEDYNNMLRKYLKSNTKYECDT
ncbi:MAG: hypothetical protein AAF465_05775 [Pseudomonadota bacterium]